MTIISPLQLRKRIELLETKLVQRLLNAAVQRKEMEKISDTLSLLKVAVANLPQIPKYKAVHPIEVMVEELEIKLAKLPEDVNLKGE